MSRVFSLVQDNLHVQEMWHSIKRYITNNVKPTKKKNEGEGEEEDFLPTVKEWMSQQVMIHASDISEYMFGVPLLETPPELKKKKIYDGFNVIQILLLTNFHKFVKYLPPTTVLVLSAVCASTLKLVAPYISLPVPSMQISYRKYLPIFSWGRAHKFLTSQDKFEVFAEELHVYTPKNLVDVRCMDLPPSATSITCTDIPVQEIPSHVTCVTVSTWGTDHANFFCIASPHTHCSVVIIVANLRSTASHRRRIVVATVIVIVIVIVITALYQIGPLPPNLTHLTLAADISQNIDSLPPSITHLTLGLIFNNPIARYPPNLTHLTFGDSFDQPVGALLPKTLTHLTFGVDFNQHVDYLPESLVYLCFGDKFNKSADLLPGNLIQLIFAHNFTRPTMAPQQRLTHLTFGHSLGALESVLPVTLTHLTFGFSFNRRVELPPVLTHLTFGDCFKQPINNFPSTLTHLIFGKYFNAPLSNLPKLTTLTFGYLFNLKLDFPQSLLQLTFGSSFCKPIPFLPHLQFLTISYEYPHSLEHLPPWVEVIRVFNLK